jgi:hypothetical protein
MDSNIDENRSVIMKTDETGLVRFLRFIENRSVTIQKNPNLRIFEKTETEKIERQIRKTKG